MNSITLKSHAKVNIGLRVLAQREDGYHNIHTIFQELAFHDTVTFSKTNDGCELYSNDENFPTCKDSSVSSSLDKPSPYNSFIPLSVDAPLLEPPPNPEP